MRDNAKTLENGFAEMQRKIEDALFNSLASAADALLLRVATTRQFIGFTGNTQTSYACGVYVNGKLEHVSVQRNWNSPPMRAKIRRGQVVYLSNPYEGVPRAVKGQVDTETDYGLDLSIRQLEEYKAPKKGLAIMMTTGTEYSVYVEQVQRLDVLTNLWLQTGRIFERNWKKIDA